MEEKIYLFNGTISTDSGIDEMDHFNASPGRLRTYSQDSPFSPLPNDLTDGSNKVERTYSNISDTSPCQLFIHSDTDSLGSEGYQVCGFFNCH